jgi:hypothetical protein
MERTTKIEIHPLCFQTFFSHFALISSQVRGHLPGNILNTGNNPVSPSPSAFSFGFFHKLKLFLPPTTSPISSVADVKHIRHPRHVQFSVNLYRGIENHLIVVAGSHANAGEEKHDCVEDALFVREKCRQWIVGLFAWRTCWSISR